MLKVPSSRPAESLHVVQSLLLCLPSQGTYITIRPHDPPYLYRNRVIFWALRMACAIFTFRFSFCERQRVAYYGQRDARRSSNSETSRNDKGDRGYDSRLDRRSGKETWLEQTRKGFLMYDQEHCWRFWRIGMGGYAGLCHNMKQHHKKISFIMRTFCVLIYVQTKFEWVSSWYVLFLTPRKC